MVGSYLHRSIQRARRRCSSGNMVARIPVGRPEFDPR